MHITSTKFTRRSGGISRMVIQGKVLPRSIVKSRYCCIHCLHDLKVKNNGLVCSYNDCHYGFIKKDDAAVMSQEVRFVKIGDMFPSEYWRGIDLLKPVTLEIEKVSFQDVKDRDTGELIREGLVSFKQSKKQLRFKITHAKEFDAFLGATGDTDNWVGKSCTIYARKEKHFGKNHLCARMRAATGQPRNNNTTTKTPQLSQDTDKSYKWPSKAAKDFFDEVQAATDNFYNPFHLLNTIGGQWFNFADEDKRAEKLDYAVSHWREKMEQAKAEGPEITEDELPF